MTESVSNDGGTGWSVLTKDEWTYLIDSRTNHASKSDEADAPDLIYDKNGADQSDAW